MNPPTSWFPLHMIPHLSRTLFPRFQLKCHLLQEASPDLLGKGLSLLVPLSEQHAWFLMVYMLV